MDDLLPFARVLLVVGAGRHGRDRIERAGGTAAHPGAGPVPDLRPRWPPAWCPSSASSPSWMSSASSRWRSPSSSSTGACTSAGDGCGPRWAASCGSAWSAPSSPRPHWRRLAHSLLGFGWTTSLIIGAALAPTDPAVVFSVLGPARDHRSLRDAARGRVRCQRPGRHRAHGQPARRPPEAAGTRPATASGTLHSSWGSGAPSAWSAVGCCWCSCGGCHCPTPRSTRSRRWPSPSRCTALRRRSTARASSRSSWPGVLVGDARAPYKREIEQFASALAGPGRDRGVHRARPVHRSRGDPR